MSYLEDVENDILTDALNQATLAQVKGHINPDELTSLQDAIHVEEALQQVKTNRYREGGSNLVAWGTRQNKQVPTAGRGGSNRGEGGGKEGYKVLKFNDFHTIGGEHFNRCTLFCFVDRYCF